MTRNFKTVLTVLVVVLLLSVSTQVFAFELPDVDFQGRTVTFVGGGQPVGWFGEAKIALAEDLFNVKIENVQTGWNEAEGKMVRLLSGDSEWDVWKGPQHEFMDMASQGAFYPV